jgi:hypothetical protein
MKHLQPSKIIDVLKKIGPWGTYEEKLENYSIFSVAFDWLAEI